MTSRIFTSQTALHGPLGSIWHAVDRSVRQPRPTASMLVLALVLGTFFLWRSTYCIAQTIWILRNRGRARRPMSSRDEWSLVAVSLLVALIVATTFVIAAR